MIAEALADRSDDVRAEAARVAHDRPSEGLRPALVAALSDLVPLVRQLAAEALARLDGSRDSASAETSEPQPATHAAEESDPPDLRLALLVAAHDGAVTMTVRELLVWLDRKILTGAALDEIEDTLIEAGLRCRPRVDDLDINGEVTLSRHEGIPEFELRSHVDALGPWTMAVRDLLRAFDRHELTSRACTEIAEALEYADLTTDRSLEEIDVEDLITIRRVD
ncbi:MAG: HEAT repeat domain-containing protein [Actinomycetota bacterium]|nr:HEAT repeat domain-containing protein [Actinomycetota bacterium]